MLRKDAARASHLPSHVAPNATAPAAEKILAAYSAARAAPASLHAAITQLADALAAATLPLLHSNATLGAMLDALSSNGTLPSSTAVEHINASVMKASPALRNARDRLNNFSFASNRVVSLAQTATFQLETDMTAAQQNLDFCNKTCHLSKNNYTCCSKVPFYEAMIQFTNETERLNEPVLRWISAAQKNATGVAQGLGKVADVSHDELLNVAADVADVLSALHGARPNKNDVIFALQLLQMDIASTADRTVHAWMGLCRRLLD